MNTIAIAHDAKIAYPVYLAWLRNDFWGAKQIVVKTPAYPAHTKGQPTMKTLAIKHNRPMNYERQFGSRFLTGGWYRQMVVTHYHHHKTTIKTLRWAQWIYYV